MLPTLSLETRTRRNPGSGFGPIFIQSSNPALHEVTPEVVGGPPQLYVIVNAYKYKHLQNTANIFKQIYWIKYKCCKKKSVHNYKSRLHHYLVRARFRGTEFNFLLGKIGPSTGRIFAITSISSHGLLYYGLCQGLLQLQAWVWVGFYKRAADFYEWFIHKMCILDTEILKKCFNYWRKWIN